MDPKLLDILVCPLCKSPLVYQKEAQELICKADRLAYKIADDIPVMLVDEARKLTPEKRLMEPRNQISSQLLCWGKNFLLTYNEYATL